MDLTVENVEKIFRDCLASAAEEEDSCCLTEGLQHTFRFSKARLDKNSDAIREMLEQLPTGFLANGGGGQSFLNFCLRSDQVPWTDIHFNAEKLLCLGLGSGRAAYCLPRESWYILPGKVPYIVIYN